MSVTGSVEPIQIEVESLSGACHSHRLQQPRCAHRTAGDVAGHKAERGFVLAPRAPRRVLDRRALKRLQLECVTGSSTEDQSACRNGVVLLTFYV